MEYHLAIKRNQVLLHTVTWVNLKNIMPSGSQSQNTAFRFHRVSKIDTPIETGSRLVAA